MPRPSRTRASLVALLAATMMLAMAVSPSQSAQALTGTGTRLHDPSVIKVGTCYYGFSTGFENDAANPAGSVTIHKSCGSATGPWTKVGNTWSSTPAWITAALGSTPPNIWAPDINYFNNKYYLYYSSAIWGHSDAVMGLMTATNIEGPWMDQGMVTNVNYPIDPTVDWGPDGRLYVTWGSFGGIYMHVLDTTTGKLSTTDHNLWNLATGMEGTSIVLNGGYYYLFGSKGSCCSGTSSTYYTAVGRSTSITGPYLDQNGTALTSSGGTAVLTGPNPKVAAGGGDFYDDGSNKYFAYHYYDANNAGRETLDIRQTTFSGGWPLLGAPLGTSNVHLQNGNSGKCADVWDLSTANQAAVNQGNCHSGTNQQWTLTSVGSNYQLVNVNSGKCLEMYGNSTANSTPATQYTCNGGANQRWTKTAVIGGYVTFTNVNSGKCLEVYGNSTTNGAAMNQYTCNGGRNQQWMIG